MSTLTRGRETGRGGMGSERDHMKIYYTEDGRVDFLHILCMCVCVCVRARARECASESERGAPGSETDMEFTQERGREKRTKEGSLSPE